MKEKIDYLAIERKNHKEGSYNAAIKELVVAIRHVLEDIPATEIKQNMPQLYALEKRLHHFDDLFEQSKIEYLNEIWELLENEPEPDETKSYGVFQVIAKENNEISLIDIDEYFIQKIVAEEWIKESGTKGIKYTIIEIIEPE